MALERTKSLQRVNSVAKSAASLIRAQNVPGEIGHCLQLVQLVHDDVHYLAELRDENLEKLEESPRELSRLDKIIEKISHTLADIDSLMDKYKPGDQMTSNTSVMWVLGDAESFKIRSANLQAQHATLLNEINHVKMMQLMARTSMRVDRHFENVNLLANLIGGKNKTGLGITDPNERPASIPSSDELTKSRALSTSSTASSSSPAQQKTTTTYTPNFQYSTLPQAATPTATSRPASQSNPGLRTLFQPTPPLGHRKRAPSEGIYSSHHSYFSSSSSSSSSNPVPPRQQQYRPSITQTPPPLPTGFFELEGSQASYFPPPSYNTSTTTASSASTSRQTSLSTLGPQELPPEPAAASASKATTISSPPPAPPSNPPRPLHEEVSALSLTGQSSSPHLREEPSALSLAPSTTSTATKRSLSPTPPQKQSQEFSQPHPHQPQPEATRNRGLSTLFSSRQQSSGNRARSADGRGGGGGGAQQQQQKPPATLYELDSGGTTDSFTSHLATEEKTEKGGEEGEGEGEEEGQKRGRKSTGGRGSIIYKWWEPRVSELSLGVVGGGGGGGGEGGKDNKSKNNDDDDDDDNVIENEGDSTDNKKDEKKKKTSWREKKKNKNKGKKEKKNAEEEKEYDYDQPVAVERKVKGGEEAEGEEEEEEEGQRRQDEEEEEEEEEEQERKRKWEMPGGGVEGMKAGLGKLWKVTKVAGGGGGKYQTKERERLDIE